VFATANENLAPLRVAREGSLLLLIDTNAEWTHVEFQDPELGRRTGYVQTKFVRFNRAPGAPTPDVAVVQAPAATPVPFTPEPSALGKSRSMGFFIGVAYESNGAVADGYDTEGGSGLGFTVGYGFTPHVALYGQFSGASIEAPVANGKALGHFDLGIRLHFRAPEKTVVPFVQIGLSGRAVREDYAGDTVEAGGAGVAFGGGINAHFSPAVAFSVGVTWSVGNLSEAKLNGVAAPVDSLGFTTARVHFGIVWFPQAKY